MPALLINIIVTVAITVASFVGVYNFVPQDLLQITSTSLGGATSITTIAGTDTLSSSRTVINDNFSSLNDNKLEISGLSSTTTLPNLVSIGTITTGTWNATPVVVAFGGTGSTTLSSNQLLLGNGTGILKTVDGFGASGQFLTSQGAASEPQWTTGSIDLTANRSFTGFNTFGNATSSQDTTTNKLTATGNFLVEATTTTGSFVATTSAISIGGIDYEFPGADGDDGDTLTTDGAGKLAWGAKEYETLSVETYPGNATGTVALQLNTNTTATFAMFFIPRPFDLSKVTLTAEAVGTAGTLNIAIYTLIDGITNKVMDITTGSISSPGRFTTSTTTTALSPGTYYIGIKPIGTADISILTYNTNTDLWSASDSFGLARGITSEPAWIAIETSGEISVMPDVFDETAGTTNGQFLFRFDN